MYKTKKYMKSCYKNILISIMAILFSFNCISCTDETNIAENSDGKNKIVTDFRNDIGDVNKKLFGNNFVGYDPVPCKFRDKAYYGHSDYGEGIWNPGEDKSVKEVVNLAKEAGITIVRFPGGCGTHHYNWKAAVGKKRGHFLYGIDEFLKTCAEIGAEPVMTVSYFTGNEQDAADLVEYLNSPNDKNNPNGGMDWAAQRAENGHPLPYEVRYFEVGNEVWHGDHQNIKKVLPEEYAKRYLQYYERMKAVDPSIKIGCILHTQDWNLKVLETVKEKIDFGIVHTYPSPEVSSSELAKMSAKDIFRITFINLMALDKCFFQDVLTLLKKKSGRDIPIAITEYNGGFVQEHPIPYRHCLGTALLNAEMLRIFMKPEHNILMANYWDFVNEYWGMVANGFYGNYKTLNKPYHKRPNYYVYKGVATIV